MNYTHILWDFNGTLLDDVGVGIESVNLLLTRRGLPPLRSRAEYHAHFRFPIIEYYRSLGFDFEKEPYKTLADEWVEEYNAREARAPLCPHVIPALEYIKSKNVPQILFSATEKDMLAAQVKRLGVGAYFTELLGADDVYAHGKIAVGKAWVARTRPGRALLIGDTLHDAEAAREMGVECVLIAAGHQARATLQTANLPVLGDAGEVPAFLRKTGDAAL